MRRCDDADVLSVIYMRYYITWDDTDIKCGKGPSPKGAIDEVMAVGDHRAAGSTTAQHHSSATACDTFHSTSCLSIYVQLCDGDGDGDVDNADHVRYNDE